MTFKKLIKWSLVIIRTYNITYQLYILQQLLKMVYKLLEQIVPYFQPDYTVTIINMIPKMSIKRDVPIVLGDITYEDNYDGDFNTRRAVIYTMTFATKTYLYESTETWWCY